MNVNFSKTFDKQFSKLSMSQKQSIRDAIELFSENSQDNALRNYPLKDKWASYRSITADEDLRLHYRIVNNNTALFVAVGSHNQLHK